MSLRKLSMTLVLVTCGLLCAASAKADPLTFSGTALNINGVTPVGGIDLFSNPNLVITTKPDGVVVIQVRVSGDAGLSDTLRITATNQNGNVLLGTTNQAFTLAGVDQLRGVTLATSNPLYTAAQLVAPGARSTGGLNTYLNCRSPSSGGSRLRSHKTETRSEIVGL